MAPDPNVSLISEEELQEIRRLWRTEEQDWEDSLPRIYSEETGEELGFLDDDITGFSVQDKELLFSVAQRHDVPGQLLAKLLDIEREMHGMSRRAGIYQKIDAALREDWFDDEQLRELYED